MEDAFCEPSLKRNQKETNHKRYTKLGLWVNRAGNLNSSDMTCIAEIHPSYPLRYSLRWNAGVSRGSIENTGPLEGELNRLYQIFPKLFHLVISHHLMEQEEPGWGPSGMNPSGIDWRTSLKLGMMKVLGQEQFRESSSRWRAVLGKQEGPFSVVGYKALEGSLK